MLLHPFKDFISPPLAARSRAIFSILDIISNAEALGLAKNSTNIVGGPINEAGQIGRGGSLSWSA